MFVMSDSLTWRLRVAAVAGERCIQDTGLNPVWLDACSGGSCGDHLHSTLTHVRDDCPACRVGFEDRQDG